MSALQYLYHDEITYMSALQYLYWTQYLNIHTSWHLAMSGNAIRIVLTRVKQCRPRAVTMLYIKFVYFTTCLFSSLEHLSKFKGPFCNTAIRPVILCGPECWIVK